MHSQMTESQFVDTAEGTPDKASRTRCGNGDPKAIQKLDGEMMAYLKQVGARFPKVNPGYDPEAYKSVKDYAERAMLGPFEGRRPLEDDEK